MGEVESLVLRHLEAIRSDIEAMKKDITSIKINMATRSQFLGLSEVLSQFDNHIAIIDTRLGAMESSNKD